MGGRRGDISTKSMGEAKVLWGQHGARRKLPATSAESESESGTRRERLGTQETRLLARGQGPWFAKRMGLSAIGILQRQDRQASRFGCRSRLGGHWPGGAPSRRGSSWQASEVRASGQTTARMVGGGRGADRLGEHHGARGNTRRGEAGRGHRHFAR